MAVVMRDLEAVDRRAGKDQEIRKRDGHAGGSSTIGEC